MSDDSVNAWQQHYPTYQFYHRDIVLAEYEVSAGHAATEEKLFLTTSNVSLLVAAAVSSLAVGRIELLYGNLRPFLPPPVVYSLLVSVLLLISGLTLQHFAERQKSIQFAKRKLVVLRSMLGLDYGHLQLVLPNWRLEGATQPFAIRLFPGWWSYAAYPFWIVGVFSSVILFVFTAHFLHLVGWPPSADWMSAPALALVAAIGWMLLLAVVYRRSLLDTHERFLLSLARGLANLLHVSLIDSFEYIIYRARLAVHELDRLGYQTAHLERLAVFVEDRRFYHHRGFSLRAAARALRDYIKRHRISGGSTITQQLVRTLFIEDYHKLVRRKLVEFVLAAWLEEVMTKRDILRIYLASVRFDEGVSGVAAAGAHFFETNVTVPTPGAAFLLLERVGNVRGRVLTRRVDHLLTQAVEASVLGRQDAWEAVSHYERLVHSERLQPDNEESFIRLVRKWGGTAAVER